MNNRTEEKLFDITLFTWEEWDELETGFLQFYNIEFPFESMKKYNGMDASMDMNGDIAITNNEDGEEIWRGFACEIPEFMSEMMKKFA